MFDKTIENIKDKVFNRVALVVWNPDAMGNVENRAGNYVVLRVTPDEVPARAGAPEDTYLSETKKVMRTFTTEATASGSGPSRSYSITLGTGEQKPIVFPTLAA